LNSFPETDVSSVWTSGTSAGRFDVHYSRGEDGRVLRIDGRGTILRDRSYEYVAAEGAIWDTITSIHTNLWVGDAGAWLIGVSGVLLLSNIVLGLKLAWPKRRGWRKAMFARPAGQGPAKVYGWHRKVGLWFALPALLTITAGVLLVFSEGAERALGAELSEPATSQVIFGDKTIGFAAAVAVANRAFPRATFSGASLPDVDAPWYRIRVRNPGELPRKWGTTVIYVSAADGRVLQAYNAATPRPARAIVDSLYAIHTGQAGGIAGRIMVLSIGAMLLALLCLGLSLWWKRRASKRAKFAGGPPRPAHFVGVDPIQG
jgi:uncharacterized iron-regulated membrane protein